MRNRFIAILIGVSLSAGVCAAGPDESRLPSADSLLRGIVQESDVALVFSYLREAIAAAMAGREARPPGGLEQRAAAIGEELKRRGVLAGQALIDEIERGLREDLREFSKLPPPNRPLQGI